MSCPNCQADFHEGMVCPECGVDIVVYKHSVMISDRLYNQGLRYLKSGDMTHGIKDLTKCVTINKNHVAARNLLGLALFEIGHVGEAVKHWILSQTIMSEANPATKYITLTEENVAILEDCDEAITRYNRALEFLKQRNDAAAVVQLKTAIELNPKFVDALNMLSLCYLIKNNIDAATPLIERALKVDPLNPVAKNYDSIVNPSGKKKQKQVRSETKSIPQLPVEEPPVVTKGGGSHMVKILLFVIGFAAAFVLLFFMIIQPSQAEHAAILYDARQEWAEREAYILNNLTEATNELNSANNTINSMNIEINNLETTNRRQDAVIRITQAYLFSQDGYWQDAMELIDAITDFTSLSPEVNRRLEVVISGAYPRLTDHYFTLGSGLFSEGDLISALNALERAYRFIDGNMEAVQMPELLFMLSSLSIEFSMNTDALHYLNLLQDNFPNHRTAEVAELLGTILGEAEDED